VSICQVRRAGHNRALGSGFGQRFQSATDAYPMVAIVV
jgi:hypothetical protein